VPIYDYLLAVECAVSAYYVGDHASAITTNNELLLEASLPAHNIEQVVRNRRFSLDALHRREPGAAVERIVVVVPACASSAVLDEAIGSALVLEARDCEVLVLHNGTHGNVAARVPDPEQIRAVDCVGGGWWRVAAAVERMCSPRDVVAILPPGHRLAGPGVLPRLRESFEDANCLLPVRTASWRRRPPLQVATRIERGGVQPARAGVG
jgi:hypothetical protein